MTTSEPPVLVHAGPLPDERSSPAGWTTRSGFMLPDQPWDLTDRRWICEGVIDDVDAAQAAIVAVARGVGLSIVVTLAAGARQRFLEDLHKMTGIVDIVVSNDDDDAATTSSIGELHGRLLDALAAGATVTAAAAQLNVSRRTANRLLAEARDVLGAQTTAAAVSRWAEARPR